jgi:2-polyprenyl-3-methyl-5-hydroxy-6-metoxy-1,4-benzoquinol methylase
MPDFRNRSSDIEIMDDLRCSGEVVHQTLRELETINDLLGGNYVTLNGLRRLLEDHPNTSPTITDLGCGSGDMLRLIRKWSSKHGLDPELTGVDANPFIIAFAEIHTPPECRIKFKALDIFSEDFRKESCDVVIGTLFFHHFSNEQLSAFFTQLKSQCRIGFIINDIHRHWLAYYSIKLLTRMLSRSAMVKFDAPLSVLRAFRRKELVGILRNAGITNYKIKWMWAFRWQVIVYSQ